MSVRPSRRTLRHTERRDADSEHLKEVPAKVGTRRVLSGVLKRFDRLVVRGQLAQLPTADGAGSDIAALSPPDQGLTRPTKH